MLGFFIVKVESSLIYSIFNMYKRKLQRSVQLWLIRLQKYNIRKFNDCFNLIITNFTFNLLFQTFTLPL